MKKTYWIIVTGQGNVRYVGYSLPHYFAGRYAKPLAIKQGDEHWRKASPPILGISIKHAEFGTRAISLEEATAILLTAEV